MPAIQSLKKQLRGIRSTQKLTKAMKTISTVKFSKLNGLYNGYAGYAKECRNLFFRYGDRFMEVLGEADPDAPAALVVMTANKGLCGSFNAEILQFAKNWLEEHPSALVIAWGKKAIRYCEGKKIPLYREYLPGDVPTFEESGALFDTLLSLRSQGKVSKVYVIYPRYDNMMTQTPTVCDLFTADGAEDSDLILLVPDRKTVVEKTAQTVMRAMLYSIVLESAIGAQAATLMTMRSAYDTATEYCAELEGQINRKRQSAVTADVIETSATEF